MKTFFLTFLFLFSGSASAAPELLAECNGRSWHHLVWMDRAKEPAEFLYQRRGYAFGVYAEFSVLLRENSPTDQNVVWGSEVEQFAYSVKYSGKSEIRNGKKMVQSTGAVFQKKGNVFDPIGKCWLDIKLLP